MRILQRNKKVSTRIQVDACRPSTRIRVDACRPSATLFPKLPCSLVFGHFPKMVSSLNVPGSLQQRGARGAEPLENAGGGLGEGRNPPQDAILILLFYITVFPDTQVISECLVLQYFQIHGSSKCLVLQYFQIHRSYQNAWSFSISRFRGPQNAWSSDAQSISSDTQHKRYKFRHPKYKFRHPKQAI